nr:aminopeptidase P family N-terminal domain-containing protein [Marinobacter sp. X15-166B]
MDSARVFPTVPSNRKIDPRRRRGPFKADGSVADNDRVEIGPTALAFREWEELGLTPPTLSRMREYRLQRIVGELQKRDLAGVLLFDPLNIRYATDTSNMQLWIAHNPARACFVSAAGHVILWDFHNCEHLSAHLPLVNEVRGGAAFFYFETGHRTEEHAARFAAEIQSVLQDQAGSNKRLAVDTIETVGFTQLQRRGIEITDGQKVMELARSIKNTDEINAMRCALASTEIAMKRMQQASVPGVTENDIWSILHAENIRRGGRVDRMPPAVVRPSHQPLVSGVRPPGGAGRGSAGLRQRPDRPLWHVCRYFPDLVDR